jgi:hypothetical protein
MTVPFTGALILITGMCLFFFSPKFLYAAMVVAIPFSATAVVNFGQEGEGKSIWAWFFLGALWILREAVSGVPPWRKLGWFATRQARYALLAFACAVIISLSVPLILNGTSWVPNMDNQTAIIRPASIGFGMYNLTQTAYLIFGILLAIAAAAENSSPGRLLRTLRLYVGSCIFVAAWGVFQLWCNLTGRDYPFFIFNNSNDVSALGYKQTVALRIANIGRISSVTLEPSVLASELLIALMILLVCRSFSKPLLSPKWDKTALALIAATLILSTSTTAYAGMLVALMVGAVTQLAAGKSSKLYFSLAGAAVAAGTLVIVLLPVATQIASTVIFNKLGETSGVARLQSIVVGLHDFLRYPILGTGWHTVDCGDWIFLILANTGVVGLVAFVSFLYPMLRTLWKSCRMGNYLSVILLATVGFLLVISEAGVGLEYAAGYDWLFLGLAASAAALVRQEFPVISSRAAPVRNVPARQQPEY